MSETTVKCAECGERVPKKRCCWECGSPLVETTPTRQDKNEQVSTPVQVSDSILSDGRPSEQNISTINEPPTATSGTTPNTDRANEGTSDKSASTPSSYADVTRSNSSGGRKVNSQEDNQGSLSNNESANPASVSFTVSFTVSKNNAVTAPKIDSGATKEVNEKVWYSQLNNLIQTTKYNNYVVIILMAEKLQEKIVHR